MQRTFHEVPTRFCLNSFQKAAVFGLEIFAFLRIFYVCVSEVSCANKGSILELSVQEPLSTDRQTYEHSYVRSLFDKIAPHYDFLNHFLSVGFDIRWRRRAIRLLGEYKPKSILDIATGTGDLAIEASRLGANTICGVDLSPGMLKLAQEKILQNGLKAVISVEEGSAEHLRFQDNTFDAVMVAFGIRNFSDLDLGLKEMLRVIRPGGAAVILEFSKPRRAPFKQLYAFYFARILPRLGGMISKSPEAYQYLPSTVQTFPDGERLLDMLHAIGYVKSRHYPLTMGIATIYVAEKPIQP
jgi:demethylmenaquinone methyltransferase / 2-methoxy-6-polyprenyl-1,4-benzoquinol methylase